MAGGARPHVGRPLFRSLMCPTPAFRSPAHSCALPAPRNHSPISPSLPTADPRFHVTPPPAPHAAEPQAGMPPEEALSLYWEYDGGGPSGPPAPAGGAATPLTEAAGGFAVRVGTSRAPTGRARRLTAPDGALSRALASSMTAALGGGAPGGGVPPKIGRAHV